MQGRLIDHLRNTQSVGLEDLQLLVLDEADRLLEMGFAEEASSCIDSGACFVKGSPSLMLAPATCSTLGAVVRNLAACW